MTEYYLNDSPHLFSETQAVFRISSLILYFCFGYVLLIKGLWNRGHD